jgi:hypothetical protein
LPPVTTPITRCGFPLKRTVRPTAAVGARLSRATIPAARSLSTTTAVSVSV